MTIVGPRYWTTEGDVKNVERLPQNIVKLWQILVVYEVLVELGTSGRQQGQGEKDLYWRIFGVTMELTITVPH